MLAGSDCQRPGPDCSKLTMPLVNILLKFQTLIFEKCQYVLVKKYEKLLHCDNSNWPYSGQFKLHAWF